jgi:hypothetical protein
MWLQICSFSLPQHVNQKAEIVAVKKYRNLIYCGLLIVPAACAFTFAISWFGELAAQIAFCSLFLIPVFTCVFVFLVRQYAMPL